MTTKTHILYIDDEADIRGIVEYALEDEAAFSLEMCASGQEAITKVAKFKPDLILLDVMMPGMDGPTTLMKLRDLPNTRTTPVIFVTAKVQPHEIAQFKSLGAIAVIAKPFDPISLAPQLRQHLALINKTTPKTKSGKFAALREVYQQELPGRIEAINANWHSITATHADEATYNELHRQLHSLAGSGLSFGYAKLGDLAREIEYALTEVINGKQELNHQHIAKISKQLHTLHELASADPETEQQPLHTPTAKIRNDEERLVYVIEDDPALLELIRAQLQLVGWQVKTFADATSAKHVLNKALPSAIIIDLSLPEGKFAGIKLLQKFQTLAQNNIPQIVISSTWTWESRLAAARAGVDAYLHKPLDLTLLIEQLEKLTSNDNAEPYRVLIVEDTVSLAHYYAQVLESAGMQTKVVTEPQKLLEALAAFQPELILMDVYMPGCSGIEAARVIRQDSKFLSVPIVFLSSEAERQRQLGAMQTGADDFLVKPIADAELISAVTLRAERFRNLSTVIHQDSLTGLLNHVSFKLQMEAEYARSKRAESNLSFALLDVDHFKSVNDNFGHPAGDRVLKSLAQVLRTRLRKSDVIGRYGGEEFAILMPDTTQEQAEQVMNNLREQFALLRFVTEASEFGCTFSAGISTSTEYENVETLIQAADTALYEAKHAGRNRICPAPNTGAIKPKAKAR